MTVSYQEAKLADGDVFIGAGALQEVSKVDSVVFDCDGTLIDVRESYDTAIISSVASLTKGILGEALPIDGMGARLIMETRRTGGFNSDWDTTYALTLFSAAAMNGQGARGGLERLQRVVRDFGSEERLDGWRSADDFLVRSGLESERVKEVRKRLGYPGTARTSRLASTFDQLYYGVDLYRRIYGVDPETGYKIGLIDKERVIVTRETLKRVSDFVGDKRLAIATGRPFIAVERTLGKLLDYFERDASVYIGDGDIYPQTAAMLSKFRKPSGESLLLAKKEFSSQALLYVGDSAEDRIMVRNAGPGGGFLFAGIYGGSADEGEQISYFSSNGSEVIVKNVNQISSVLEMSRD